MRHLLVTSVLLGIANFSITTQSFYKVGVVVALMSMMPPVQATTVAFDGKTMSADSQWTAGTIKGPCYKITKVPGAYIACAGRLAYAPGFCKWYSEGHKPELYPKMKDGFEAFVLTKDGLYDYEEDSPYGRKDIAPCAMGTGSKAALGAMKAGADSAKSISIASEIDLYTGGKVTTVSIEDVDK